MKPLFIILLLVSFAYSFTADLNKTRNLALDAAGINLLEIDCGAGFLKVKGNKDSQAIKVKAEIYIDVTDTKDFDEIIEKELRLELKQHGKKAKLEAGFEQTGPVLSRFFGSSISKRIDLTIEVPEYLSLAIDDGSGTIYIKNVNGDIMLDDGSGSVEIFNAGGKIKIDDGSGSLDLRHIGGSVYIEDGSGSILCDDIQGDCVIDDGSGDLTVMNVTGDVTIDDSSGSIEIDTVNGDVIIKDDGSGTVSISGVTGKVYRHDEE